MEKKFNLKFDDINESLIKSIIFFLLGVVLFTNPNKVVTISLYVIAGLFLLLGLFKILSYYKHPDNKNDVIIGTMYLIFSITVALFTLLLFNALETIFRYTVAVFFLYTGIIRIIASFSKPKRIRTIYLINSLVMIGAAIAVALIPGIGLSILGLIIIFYSLIEIVTYIFYKKESKDITIEGKVLVEKESKEEIKQIEE